MSIKSKLEHSLVALAAAFLMLAVPVVANAQGKYYGGDYSKYQTNLFNNTGHDSFAIDQIGGDVNGYIYNDWTYGRHAQQARNNGWHFHTYIWDQTGSNSWETQRMLNYFLPRLQQPRGAIVALDYEAGASWNVEANTDAILTGMRQIKNSGYTPMLYSYRPYLQAHVDVNRVLAEFPNSIWVAGYQSGLSVWPNFGYFPSMNGVAIWQYSDYGGQQDLNVDLTGITQNGYTNHSTGAYNAPKVQQPKPTQPVQNRSNQAGTYVVQPGDSWWLIASKHGMSMYDLASLNGKSINSTIYPGQVLKLNRSQVNNNKNTTKGTTWTDGLGDTWHTENGTFTSNSYINLRWGAKTSSSCLAMIHPGDTIKYDAWSRHDGYVWVRQPRNNGYAYLAVRGSNNQAFGYFNK